MTPREKPETTGDLKKELSLLRREKDELNERLEAVRKEAEVDPENLDLEWTMFPEKNLSAMDALSSAKDLERRFKSLYEVLKGILYQEASSFLKDRGERVTEAAIQSEITAHPMHFDFIQFKNEVETLVSKASDISWAMSAKKSALENLVTLWSAKYFAGPAEPLDLSGRHMLAKQKTIRENSNKAKDAIKKVLKRKGEAQ